jgi:large subunit ribosomal protein L47
LQAQKTMARIKLVLNERRLGLIAAVAPTLEERDPMPLWSDPSGSQKALWAQTTFTDVRVPKAHRHLLETAPTPDSLEQTQSQEGEEQPIVDESELSETEVEGRDEGFGGGKEAEQFVDDVEVGDDGRVHKK